MTHRVPEIVLERYALGELSTERMEEVRLKIETEPGGPDRLAALQDSNTEILKDYPERWFEGAVVNKQRRNRSPNRAWAMLVPILAVAAGLTIFAAPEQTLVQQDETAGEIIYLKGDARLEVWRQEGPDQHRLTRDDTIREGERLQIRYLAMGKRYGAIYSIDGRGAVTQHLPLRGSEAAAMHSGATRLEQSYQLDDAPNYERFVFVTADEPFSLHEVDVAVRDLAADPARAERAKLPISNHFKQWSMTLHKGQ